MGVLSEMMLMNVFIAAAFGPYLNDNTQQSILSLCATGALSIISPPRDYKKSDVLCP